MDVAAWLKGLGLEHYEAAFRDNEIDWRVLPSLTADDLKDIGITAVGHQRRLLEAIAALRLPAAPAPAPPGFAGADRRQLTVMFCDQRSRQLFHALQGLEIPVRKSVHTRGSRGRALIRRRMRLSAARE